LKIIAPRLATALVVVLGIALVGYIDYITGSEIRIFPLYYLPIVLAAWKFRRTGAVLASLLASGAWLASLLVADHKYSSNLIWTINTVTQAIAFLVVSMLVAKLHDVIAREEALGRIDLLTELCNVRGFNEQADRVLALCNRYARPVTLAFIDIDNFKNVNDTLGHSAGDLLLRKVATVLKASFRSSDIIARFGGDEFVVLLPETEADHASALLEKLRLRLLGLPEFKDSSVSASIGAIAYSNAPEQSSDMIKRADTLMYTVKRTGKNRVMLEKAPPWMTANRQSS